MSSPRTFSAIKHAGFVELSDLGWVPNGNHRDEIYVGCNVRNPHANGTDIWEQQRKGMGGKLLLCVKEWRERERERKRGEEISSSNDNPLFFGSKITRSVPFSFALPRSIMFLPSEGVYRDRGIRKNPTVFIFSFTLLRTVHALWKYYMLSRTTFLHVFYAPSKFLLLP